MFKSSFATFPYYRYPLEAAIRRIAGLGYEGVEIWGGRPHAYCDDMSPERLRAIRSVVEDCGIAQSNFIPAQFRYPTNLAAPDSVVRKNSVDYLRKSIDVAAELGSPRVSICPGYSLYGQGREAAWDCMLDSLQCLLDHARGLPVQLLLEPANRYETDLVITLADGLKAARELDGGLGILADTGHLFINGESLTDAMDVLRQAGVPSHFHLDDNLGLTDDHMVPGKGKIDFSTFFESLARHGYEDFLAVELGFQYSLDPDPAALASRRFLRQFQDS